MELSIIVPTFMERENIPRLLKEMKRVLAPAAITYEIIIVDDNSPDDTAEVCQKLLAGGHPLRLIVRTKERGLSSAVIRGFKEARGQFIACMDGDLSHPPSALLQMLQRLCDSDAEIVIGSRYIAGGSTDAQWGWLRKLNSQAATFFSRPFSGHARDPMAGYFMLRRDVYARQDRLNPIGYKILLEIICKCRITRVAEVPIHFQDRRFGKSKLNLMEQLRYLRHLYRLYEYKYTTFYEFTHFCMVGASGMVLDLMVVHTTHHFWRAGFANARIWGIGCAIIWNFALNRRFTFLQAPRENIPLRFIKFVLACSFGAAVNWSVSMSAYDHLPLLTGRMARCAVLGVFAGTLLNFILSKYFVFRALRFFSPRRIYADHLAPLDDAARMRAPSYPMPAK